MQNDLDIPQNHIGGNFKWDIPPKCTCGMFRDAIEKEHFVFVSDRLHKGWNGFYMHPVCANGESVRADGISITHCPFCGDEIKAKKFYPTNE
ncbi:hypothetical protein [Celeribacter halophilus]|uniref:hypothetical protein n=1 Tax=Celeribacter halophilus TaxID=576117 RepID=UPI003A950701